MDELSNVVHRHIEPPAQQDVGFCRQQQSLPSSGAAAPLHPFRNKVRCDLVIGPCRAGETSGVVRHVTTHWDTPDQVLKLHNLFAGNHGAQAGHRIERRLHQDLLLFFQRWVINIDHEQKTIQLRLRQPIGPLLLDRVLRGQYQEGLGQGVRHAAHRHMPFLHAFQQGRLGLGRGPVDLISQQHVGENRATLERE